VYGQKEAPAHASHYTPKFVPGARLPHAWISRPDTTIAAIDVSYVPEFSAEEVKAKTYSTLDLCDFDAVTLVVGSQEAWSARFDALTKICEKSNIKLRLYAADSTFKFVDPKGEALFDENVQLGSGGGLLVGPDQHVLEKLTADSTVDGLKATIFEFLGL
jgi:hypothetical protein